MLLLLLAETALAQEPGDSISSDTLALDSLAVDSVATDSVAPKPLRRTPKFAIKNNLLYDAVLTPNLSLEFRVAKHWTMQLDAGFNPFPLSDEVEHKWRHLLLGLEAKYWFRDAFACDFIGVNAVYSHFNVAQGWYPIGWLYKDVRNYRLQGDMVAAGVSYGWHFVLSKHVGLELEAGVDGGYAWFNRYGCAHCDALVDSPRRWFAMPKAGVNLAIVLPGDEDRDDDCPCRKKNQRLEEPTEQQPAESAEEASDLTGAESATSPILGEDLAKAEPEAISPIGPTAEQIVQSEAQERISPISPISPIELQPSAPLRESPFASRILRPFTEYQPYTTDYVLSRDSDALCVYFELDSFVLKRHFGRNAEVLDSIVMLVEELMADTTDDLKLIQLVGFASFDGPAKRNNMLAGNRAQALKTYIQEHFPVPDSLFEVNNGGEAWAEMLWQLEQSDYTLRDQVMRIIREEPNLDRREWAIKALDRGRTFIFLRDQILEKYRNAGYIRVYYEPKEKVQIDN